MQRRKLVLSWINSLVSFNWFTLQYFYWRVSFNTEFLRDA
jgi:hypothetical protein